MGQTLLPWKEKLIGVAEQIVNWAYTGSRTPKQRRQMITDEQNEAVNKYYESSDVKQMSDVRYLGYTKFLEGRADYYKDLYAKQVVAYKTEFPEYQDKKSLEGIDAMGDYAAHRHLGRFLAYDKLLRQAKNERNIPENKTESALKPSGSGSGDGGLSDISGRLDRVTGASQAPRNITVNIEAFNKGGINTQNTSLQKMDTQQIEDWFTDMCYRAIRNVELSE
jgi:hypothetical protein